MVDSIIAKMLGKIILASVCAVILAMVTIALTDIAWQAVLLMLVLVLVSFASTFMSLKKAVAEGKIVAVYGNCISRENAKNMMGKTQRNMFSYRFISVAATDNPKENAVAEDEVASFYIKGEKGKFVEGESYCLLFKKYDNGEDYSESNLIGYEVARTAPVTIPLADNNDAQELDACSPQEETEQTSSNVIYFNPKEAKGGENT